ncbi:response regulator [Chryseobacterium sp.]|uniref:response regulator n=1 Tax=Chryseobacterium sp. TaxID=1871047 RepID=UPI00333F11F8
MKFIHHILTLLAAIIGLLGGIFWGYSSNWEYEPLILLLVSLAEIIAYIAIPKQTEPTTNPALNYGMVNQNVEVNVGNIESFTNREKNTIENEETNNLLIEAKKNKLSILFIDDDKNFSIVKILKDSGWKKTKAITDVKSIDINYIQNSEIIFVDINGVGKILNLEHEGLDLALMIKQKYKSKKVIIYSANKTNNAFHSAWEVVDARLEKNALPYQFQNLVENFSKDFYN